MKKIGTNDGVIEVDSIIAMGVKEENAVFKILFICKDNSVHVFDEYPTLEKAERYFYDLRAKLEHGRDLKLPANFMLV